MEGGQENFLNASNSDLGPETLQLMCRQAATFPGLSPDISLCLELASEVANVAEVCEKVVGF